MNNLFNNVSFLLQDSILDVAFVKKLSFNSKRKILLNQEVPLCDLIRAEDLANLTQIQVPVSPKVGL